MHALQREPQSGPVGLRENVAPDLDEVVRPDADHIAVERSVMDRTIATPLGTIGCPPSESSLM